MAITPENHGSSLSLEQNELSNLYEGPTSSDWQNLEPLKVDLTEAPRLMCGGDKSDANFMPSESEKLESDVFVFAYRTGSEYYAGAQKLRAKIEAQIQRKEINTTDLANHPEMYTLFNLLSNAYKLARDNFTKACAGYQVMHRLDNGIGVEVDKKQAQEIRANIGVPFLYLVSDYSTCTNVQNPLEYCVEICEFLLKEGHSDYVKARAYFNLGQCYVQGDDQVKRNHEMAMRYFQKAAQFIDPKIQFYSLFKLFMLNIHGWIGNDGQKHKNIAEGNKYLEKLLDLIQIDPQSKFSRQLNEANSEQEKMVIIHQIVSYIHQKYFDTPVGEDIALQTPNAVALEVASDIVSSQDLLNRLKTVQCRIAHIQHHPLHGDTLQQQNGGRTNAASQPTVNNLTVLELMQDAQKSQPKTHAGLSLSAGLSLTPGLSSPARQFTPGLSLAPAQPDFSSPQNPLSELRRNRRSPQSVLEPKMPGKGVKRKGPQDAQYTNVDDDETAPFAKRLRTEKPANVSPHFETNGDDIEQEGPPEKRAENSARGKNGGQPYKSRSEFAKNRKRK